MKTLGRTLPFIVAALLTLQGLAAMAAQPARTDTGPDQVALAAPDREALVQEILGLWANAPNPVVGENLTQYGDLRAALRLATVEQLLEARQARTYADVRAALPKRATSETKVVPLALGQRIPQVIGDNSDDLVYTPVSPCRIIDTRGGVAPWTGLLGPNSGKQFFVALSDYSPQGGFAGSCGIPTSPFPAAVAINLTSTGQTGTGNLRAIQSGGGVPNVSLVNYVTGVNIANAAIVPACHNCSAPDGDIFIYSGNSQSHAVVDIMGYFNPPAATPLDIVQAASPVNACANNAFCSMTATCPAGYVATGGGPQVSIFTSGVWWVYSAFGSSTSWLCQALNASGGARNLSCHATCARVPGH